MPIVLDGTTGITAPALDSDGSLTIGTAVMAVPSGDAPLFACRAWVNFDGTKDTTGAASTANTNRLIRGSGNVTSVLRNGTGDYTVTFTTAMPDANYSAVIGASPNFGVAVTVSMNIASGSGTKVAPTTTALRFSTGSTAVYHDVEYASVAIFR